MEGHFPDHFLRYRVSSADQRSDYFLGDVRMKTIKTLIEIPAQYKWIAKDVDGAIRIFVKEPKRGVRSWDANGAPSILLYWGARDNDWKNSLKRIEEYEDVTEDLK